MKRKKRCFVLFVALLLVVMLALSACNDTSQGTNNAPVVWDEIFVQELNPDEETMQALQNSVQDVNLQSSLDGVTIDIIQTLGDAKSMHIALKITFPDDLDSAARIIAPQIREFVSGRVDEDDFTALSREELIGKYARKSAMSGGGSMNFTAVQEEAQDNSFSYLISLNSDEPFVFENDIATFLIGDFTIVRGDGTGKTYYGVHAISWAPTNEAPLVDRTIIAEDGEAVGRVLLSPFSFTGSVYTDAYKEPSDFSRSIRFIQSDGTAYTPPARGARGSTGGSYEGFIQRSESYLFAQPLDLSTIKDIQIGGYTVNVQDAAE